MPKKAVRWAVIAFFLAFGKLAGGAGLPFIQDDFGRARAEALQHKVPIFIEIWAPW